MNPLSLLLDFADEFPEIFAVVFGVPSAALLVAILVSA